VVSGLCLFDKQDWTRHVTRSSGCWMTLEARCRGAHKRASCAKRPPARISASMATVQLWRQAELAERGEQVIRALFPAKSETEESAGETGGLLEFARDKVAAPGQSVALSKAFA